MSLPRVKVRRWRGFRLTMTKMQQLSTSLSDRDLTRFFNKIHRSENGCWMWLDKPKPAGYGQFSLGGRAGGMIATHRLMWHYCFGEIPLKLCVLHRCDVRLCVNPFHLFIGSDLDNVRDMMKKGRHVKAGLKGEAHPKAKLSSKEVNEIRAWAAAGVPYKQIAALFGIGSSTVGEIARFDTWKHLPRTFAFFTPQEIEELREIH